MLLILSKLFNSHKICLFSFHWSLLKALKINANGYFYIHGNSCTWDNIGCVIYCNMTSGGAFSVLILKNSQKGLLVIYANAQGKPKSFQSIA